jgi:hypothetical protein
MSRIDIHFGQWARESGASNEFGYRANPEA